MITLLVEAEREGIMITIRAASERGHTDIGWLDSKHTFSFGDYYDPEHVGFRALRVINDDRVAAGQGFGTHPHRDMEIVSYVLEGELAHGDTMGTKSIIKPGEVQRMSAGTGVLHSEFNASKDQPVHFLQIWLLPSSRGIQPSYEQKTIDPASVRGKLRLIASPQGGDGAITVHQDARIYAGRFGAGEKDSLTLPAGRHAWVHVARGKVTVNGKTLGEGDGAALTDERAVEIGGGDGEVLVFDLA
jgi:redox-sensitive bicupin YhaK (pirin superfamily)